MRIQSKVYGLPARVTVRQNLLSKIHKASLEAEVVFEGMKRRDLKGFGIEVVNSLSDPFDGDIHTMDY